MKQFLGRGTLSACFLALRRFWWRAEAVGGKKTAEDADDDAMINEESAQVAELVGHQDTCWGDRCRRWDRAATGEHFNGMGKWKGVYRIDGQRLEPGFKELHHGVNPCR